MQAPRTIEEAQDLFDQILPGLIVRTVKPLPHSPDHPDGSAITYWDCWSSMLGQVHLEDGNTAALALMQAENNERFQEAVGSVLADY